jgi:hypothetical protein
MAKKSALLVLAAATALVACGGGEGPPAPYGLYVTSSDGAAYVRWDYGSTSGVDSFLVQRSEGADYDFVDAAKTPPGQLYFNDDDVVPGEWYYYRVAAFYKEWQNERNVLSDFSAEAGVQIE